MTLCNGNSLNKISDFKFNYEVYESILDMIIKSNKYMDFNDAVNADEFILLRHDVEFSIERAYKMAAFENEKGIASSYFFQLYNNSYNFFSKKNLELVNNIKKMGHHIGLHFYFDDFVNEDMTKKEILIQKELMEKVLDFKIDRFSIHKPSQKILKAGIHIKGLINTYNHEYFTYLEKNEINNSLDILEVRYIADSLHSWKYGVPSFVELKKNKKIQLLFHPYSWNEIDVNYNNNMNTLINEKTYEFKLTFIEEQLIRKD